MAMRNEFSYSSNDIYLFKYHASLEPFPDKGLLTERSKKLFERGRPGQGYVSLEWVDTVIKQDADGKIVEERVKYIELAPAFNRDDKLPRSDKNGVPYTDTEMVISDQPRSGNTGTVHPDFIELLKGYYAGIDPEKSKRFGSACKFGGGLAKGLAEDKNLLDKIMNRSTS